VGSPSYRCLPALAALAIVVSSRAARAEPEGEPPTAPEEPVPEKPALEEPKAEHAAPKLVPIGYVEASYSYNFNRPSNGITNYRGFDNRHNTFTLANVALGAQFESDPVEARLVLQMGHTPSSYYAAEPARAGAAGANASDAALWKYLQEAWVAYKAPVGRGLRLQLGLTLSPVGIETMAIRDSWNWSRSNLFYGLPFYHTGLKATYSLTDSLSISTGVYNGWNSVVDNNEEKSVTGSIAYKADGVAAQLLYFGGIERPTGSREGPYWRHLFDAYAQWDVTDRVSVMGQADAGFEPNRFGTSHWYAGAIYGRLRIVSWLYFAARGDRFWEDSAGATPLFWPVRWVSSGTATVDVRPHDHVSVRLEYRHDQADGDIYFKRDVATDASGAFVPNANAQDTTTLGVTGWL
jgi:hypothetical protein